MLKLPTILTAAALAFACIVPVHAQTQTGTAAQAAYEHSMRASKLVGMSVHNQQNQAIGSIVEILVDDHTGMATAVLSVGDYVGNGSKMVVVPITHIKLDAGKPMMPATQTMLKAMPPFSTLGDLAPFGSGG